MMVFVRCVLAVQLAGCSFGLGSAYVGQWKPRKQVEFEACLLDDEPGSGRCKDKKQVVSEVPGRKYWGVILPFPAIGGSRVSYEGSTTTEFRAEPSFEFLRGHGRWALGVRTGVVIDGRTRADGKGGTAGAFTTNVIGHLSVFDELSVYAGIGHAYGNVLGERTFAGARGLAGLQFALNKTHGESFIVLSLELDRMYLQLDESYRSTGLTGHLGLFF